MVPDNGLEDQTASVYNELRGFTMKQRWLVAAAIYAALVLGSHAQERVRIVATTSDLRSLAKVVGAERVVVSNLVPPGESPEGYQPRLQDVGILKGAVIVVRAGSGIDPWFDKLLTRSAARNGRTGIERGEDGHLDASLAVAPNDPLAVSAGFARTRRASRGGPNPHYWLDPKSADAITAMIATTLARIDPANATYYEANRRDFLVRLNSKINEWQSRLIALRDEPMIAFHDDWRYFAGRFRLNIVDYMATRDRAPPRRAKMAELIKLIRERGIKLILAEANQPERHANRLAQQTGARVVLLAGSVGELPQTDDYIAMFDANVNALLAAKDAR
ncbi:MAG: Manganese ABC transporter substrate-binding lipoprotein [Pseudorhodoplanes sp.]|nr:Manganese ABC transporter substrate-binding lipoprotein [Pseudorhodoplanes sp.]